MHNHDHRPAYANLREALLAGDASRPALPPDLEAQIDAFITLRMLNTVEWILDSWAHPAQRRWGPGFLRASQPVFDGFLERTPARATSPPAAASSAPARLRPRTR